MDLKNRLIEPDENSVTRFEPFYQLTPKELYEICKQYHKEQLMLADVVGRSGFPTQKVDKIAGGNGCDVGRVLFRIVGNQIEVYEIDLNEEGVKSFLGDFKIEDNFSGKFYFMPEEIYDEDAEDCLIQDSCLRFKQKGCNKECKLYA